MTDSFSYTAIISAKNGSLVPARNGVAFHSTYNPEREGEHIAAAFPAGETSFFVVLGLCGGFHLAALRKRFPQATILAVENTAADIAFLTELPLVQTLLEDEHVITATMDTVAQALFQHFLPAEHTGLQVVPLRAWEQQFSAEATRIKKTITQTLSAISADFSVQSHFGGIWQRNILENLKAAPHLAPKPLHLPREKTAAIIAAGPSLDHTAAVLKERRADFYIIATDTGYRALLHRGIVSDAVVSVDAQMISHAHFFDLAPETLCVFDLCAHPALIRKAAAQNQCVLAETGHPLAVYASQGRHFSHLNAGSGTVTVAAASFAISAGFSRIRFFGADFAYARGKAYTQGSYLDDLYHTASSRIKPAETQFTSLLFRTELKKTGTDSFTTDILESYRTSLEDFMAVNKFTKNTDNEYICKCDRTVQLSAGNRFDYDSFARTYIAQLSAAFGQGTAIDRTSYAFITLLPYIAWLQRKKHHRADFAECARLAYTKTREYTAL